MKNMEEPTDSDEIEEESNAIKMEPLIYDETDNNLLSQTSDLPRSGEEQISDTNPRSISSESANEQVCRLCAARNNDMIPIFGQDRIHGDITEKIKRCLPTISVKESDTITKLVCRLCLAKLELCYDFYKTVTNAEEDVSNNNHDEATSFSTELQVTERNIENCNVDSVNSNPQSNSSSFPVLMSNLQTKGKRTESLNGINEPSTSQIGKNICNSVASEKKKKASDKKSRSSKKSKRRKTGIIRHIKIPKCHTCNKVFENFKDCHEHANDHFSRMNFPCSFCGKSFPNQDSWRKHSWLHVFGKRGTLNRLCDVCGKKFATRARLEFHKVNSHNVDDTSTQCAQCAKILDSEKSLDEHKLNVHIKPKMSFCKVCKKRFRNIEDLDAHEEKNDCHLECEICKITFDSDDTFEMHNQENHSDPTSKVTMYRCRHCEKKFKRSVDLASHVSHHHADKKRITDIEPNPYVCNFCDETFSDYEAAAMHMRKHMDEIVTEEPLECNENKFEMHNEENHSTPTSKVTMYRCRYCEKEFKRSVELASHVSHHHTDKKRITDIEPKPYDFNFCDETFSDYGAAAMHTREHMDETVKEEPLECNENNSGFVSVAELLLSE